MNINKKHDETSRFGRVFLYGKHMDVGKTFIKKRNKVRLEKMMCLFTIDNREGLEIKVFYLQVFCGKIVIMYGEAVEQRKAVNDMKKAVISYGKEKVLQNKWGIGEQIYDII